jgi:hypothetical protein
MVLGSYKVWAPLAVVLAITISMHRRSFQAVSNTAMDVLNDLPFVPSRLDKNLFGAATADTPNEKNDQPKEIDKPLNVVIMYGDDWRHDAIVSKHLLDAEQCLFFLLPR